MTLYDSIRIGTKYVFDLTVPTANGEHREMVEGRVLEKTTVGTTQFLILDRERAINMDYVTRALGRF